MRMLFSSTDGALIRRVRNNLDHAGLPSAIRIQARPQGTHGVPAYLELWVPALAGNLSGPALPRPPRRMALSTIKSRLVKMVKRVSPR